MNKNVIIGIAVVLVLVGGIGVYKFVQLQAEAAKWSNVKEIVDEESSVVRDGIVTRAHFVSIIDGPLDRVQAAVWRVEDSAQVVKNVTLSDLVKQSGNTKTLKMRLKALNLPSQHYTMEFTLHPAEHRITFKTIESQAQDISGSYQFETSPDGKRTRLIYDSEAKDKVHVPFPQSVIEGAMRETFVNTVRGVVKTLRAAG